MKYVVYIFFFILSIPNTLGQQINSIQATYSYVNVGLNQNFKSELLLDNKNSFYRFIEAQTDDSKISEIDGEILLNVFANDKVGRWVYKDFIKETLIFRDFVYEKGKANSAVVEENLLSFDWKLINKKGKINNLNCYKAIMTFRGREYEAWYSESIPLNGGPWKFHGLPGLIVKIRSLDGNIDFNLEALQYFESKIDAPNYSKQELLTFEKYVNLKEASVDEFISRLYAKLPRGTEIQLNSVKDHNIEIEF